MRQQMRPIRVMATGMIAGGMLVSGEATAGFKRDLSTDRPDRTESPYTVEKGHVQFEITLVEYTGDKEKLSPFEFTTRSLAAGVVNAKFGLTDRIDLQIVSTVASGELYADTDPGEFGTPRAASLPSLESGGDLAVRCKINLIGNDAGTVAIALMPYLTIPDSDFDLFDEQYEFGLIVPLGFDIGGGYGMGMMAEFDMIRDWTGDLRLDLVNSVTVAREITSLLGMYVELFSQLPTTSSPGAVYIQADPGPPRIPYDDLDDDWKGTFDIGFTLGVGENVQFDLGTNIGISRASDDLTLFSGLSVRL